MPNQTINNQNVTQDYPALELYTLTSYHEISAPNIINKQSKYRLSKNNLNGPSLFLTHV
jgi:hypothetical protein